MNNEKYYLYIKDCKNNTKPITIDFLEYNTSNRELLKACGIGNKNKNIKILDCTAGLCRDSFILANAGCQITAIEQNPIIYTLLQDGFYREKNNDKIAPILNRINLIHKNSVDFLKNSKENFDCVYLDPMFEESKKSRLVKKEMQLFHHLVGFGNNCEKDNQLLFTLAKNITPRIVVKRPLHGNNLVSIKPTFTVFGKAIRFDVYSINQQ